MSKQVCGIFDAGGVKGVALAGAAKAFEQEGYTFSYCAGTSAGSIAAALLAAGYSSSELVDMLFNLDYLKFKDRPFSVVYNLWKNGGLYKGDYAYRWIKDKLEKKGVRTFSDLEARIPFTSVRSYYKLSVVASDITTGRCAIFPEDAPRYGMSPGQMEVALAVRASMSIPFFFQPQVINGYEFQDGALLSGLPIDLYDNDTDTPDETIAFKLVDPREGIVEPISNPLARLMAIADLMLKWHDKKYIEDSNFVRTVPIPTGDITMTQFDLTSEQAMWLCDSGYEAARRFLAIYKPGQTVSTRTERLMV